MPMPMLTSDNYTVWAIRAQAILDVHTVWEAVVPGDAAVEARKDKAARALLLGALPEDVLLQVATKLTAREVWDSLKVRFVGADRVRAARLATLRGDFDCVKMADGEALEVYAGRIAGMAASYTSLGETLDDEALVKKLLDTVLDRLFPVVAGIGQFCDTTTMAFDEAVGRLRAFEERVQRRGQDDGERGGEQLMLSAEQWRARERRGRAGARDDDDDRSVASSARGNHRGRCYHCNERGHFKRECPRREKAATPERALMGEIDVEDAGLL